MRLRAIGLILTLGVLWAPLVATAQPGRVPTIGILGILGIGIPVSEAERQRTPFWQGMRELGWVEGQNITVEYRYAPEGQYERLPDLAAELVRLKVDVIVTDSGTPGALVAKHATSTIPIVFMSIGDPIGAGLITSLAQPGGNITGVTSLSSVALEAKRLELLKEAVPGVIRVACLWNPANPVNELALQRTQATAQALGIQLQLVGVHNAHELANAFATITHERAEALMVHPDGFLTLHRRQIVGFATQRRLPAIYGHPQYVEAGGRLVYMANYPDLDRRAATYVDKILKRTKPADLPVEQPMRFELVINLRSPKP